MQEFRESSLLRDAKKELAHIERRGRNVIRRQKREAFKENKEKILDKQKQMSELIAGLYETVYERANGNQAEILMDMVSEHEGLYGPLDPEMSANLQHALSEYSKRHDKVGFYYRQYEQKPEELFERCFGQKPRGKVQLILGPMTLCFRCFDEEDYVFACINHKHEDKKPESSEDERSKAERSQGVAFSQVKVDDLAGCIIMEKASNNYMMVADIKTSEVNLQKNRITTIKFQSLDLRENLWWKINHVKGIPYQFNFNAVENKVVSVNLFDNEKEDFVFYDEPVEPPFTYRLELQGEKFKETEYVDITIDSEGVHLMDHSRKQHVLEYDHRVGKKQVVNDEKLSKEVRRHEEQHQFNKLFVPKEEYMGISPHLIQSLEIEMHSYDPKEAENAKKKIIVVLARHYRRMLIDSRARDEIISYYKQGSDLNSVARTLKTSPLYDYAAQEVEFTNNTKLPSYQHWIEQLIYRDLGEGRRVDNITYSAHNENLNHKTIIPLQMFVGKETFTEPEVKQVVSQVLREDYAQSIDRWIKQVKILQEIGYGRQQIIAFLNMLPVRGWQAFVRRLNKNITEEEYKSEQSSVYRPTSEDIKNKVEYWLGYKKKHPYEYQSILRQLTNVAAGTFEAEADLVENYRDWKMDDFLEVFRQLGEDPNKLVVAKEEFLKLKSEMTPTELARTTISMMAKDSYLPDEYPLNLDQLVEAIADDPELEAWVMEYFSPGGLGYEINATRADNLKEQVVKKLTATLRKRANLKSS